jgi:hypothetical protein
MAVAIRLSENMIADARRHARLSYRSVPRQIEYWYQVGKIADENPDLPLTFIKNALEARKEMLARKTSPFEFRTDYAD